MTTEIQTKSYQILDGYIGREMTTELTSMLRSRILRRDNYTCQRCHKQSDRLEIDHIVPRCQGGLDSLQNLRTLCNRCHRMRHHVDHLMYKIFMNMIDDLSKEHETRQ